MTKKNNHRPIAAAPRPTDSSLPNANVPRNVARRPNRSQWIFVGVVFSVVLVGMGWQGWSWWNWAKAPVMQPGTDNSLVQVKIPPGTSAQAIGDRLQSAGIIRSSAAWTLWSRWLQLRSIQEDPGGFQAGVYLLSPTQSLAEVATVIWQGQTEAQTITIPEGWSLQKMAAYFQDQGLFTAAEFLQAATQIPYDRFPWLPGNLPSLEGFLYPETYEVSYGAVTPTEVIGLMLDQFERVALPLHEVSQTPFTVQEWVTLASIVEKEAVLPEERRRIAGVLLNRLELGMRLEVDPTVEYGLGIQQTPDRPLTLSEVRTPSPYNTYLNEGLPPTAIASPGKDSLEAVLDPEETDALYFVARYDGTHVFSTTLEDHEAAQEAIRSARE